MSWPELDAVEAAGIAIVWDAGDDAPLACYSPDPPELTLGTQRWHQTAPAIRERKVCHELGHHQTGAVYAWCEDAEHDPNICKLEAKADRRALELLIPDARIQAAIDDGCGTVAEWPNGDAPASERVGSAFVRTGAASQHGWRLTRALTAIQRTRQDSATRLATAAPMPSCRLATGIVTWPRLCSGRDMQRLASARNTNYSAGMLDHEATDANVQQARQVRSYLLDAGYQDAEIGPLGADLSDLYAAAAHYRQLLDALFATPPHDTDRLGDVLADLAVEIAHLRYHAESAVPPLEALAEKLG